MIDHLLDRNPATYLIPTHHGPQDGASGMLVGMAAESAGSRRTAWVRRGSVPNDLTALDGSLTGIVHLPLSVYSSGRGPARGFDLAEEDQRIELYELLVSHGGSENQARYLNADELCRLWQRLWLSPEVRRAREPLMTPVAR